MPRRKPHVTVWETVWEIWRKEGGAWRQMSLYHTEEGARTYMRASTGAGYVSGTLAIRKRRVLEEDSRPDIDRHRRRRA